MQGKALAALTTALLGAMTFISTASVVPTTALAAGPLSCLELKTNPAAGLAGNPLIKSVTVKFNSTGKNNYCEVQLLYGRTPDENINITVGLPLNSLDGNGQSSWNGRTQGIGGAVCMGPLTSGVFPPGFPPNEFFPNIPIPGFPPSAALVALDHGYVASGTVPATGPSTITAKKA